MLQRKTIRRDVGLKRLYDCLVGSLGSYNIPATTGTVTIAAFTHPYLSDPSASGQLSMKGGYLRVASSDYRIATVNFGYSAALTSFQMAQQAISSGADWEFHARLSATDLDNCIDQTLARFRIRQEVGIPSVAGALIYTIDGAASPNTILDVLDFWYYSNPAGSLDRGQTYWRETPAIVRTATGMELRLPANIGGSQQLALDCLLQLTLGADDAATINLPWYQDDQVVLDGAAARAYDLIINRAPGQESGVLKERRREMAMAFTRAMAKQIDNQNTDIGFESDFEKVTPAGIY